MDQYFYPWISKIATASSTPCNKDEFQLDPWVGSTKSCYCKSKATGTPELMPDHSSEPL